MSARRLPVYLLLDCSGSMAGEPIEAVRQGVRALLSDLRSCPESLETAYLSVITFADRSEQVSELTALASFREPTLTAGGSTSLGAALNLLETRIDAEVARKTTDQKGDYRPMVFLMTDGIPTDSWEEPAQRLKGRILSNLVACAAGSQANGPLLKKITENVLSLDNTKPDSMREFFRFVSDTIKSTSKSLASGGEGKATAVPVSSPHIHIVP